MTNGNSAGLGFNQLREETLQPILHEEVEITEAELKRGSLPR